MTSDLGFAGASFGESSGVFRAGDVLDGKYRIERVIAEGGVAVVVQAEQLGLDRHVAIKLLRPEARANREMVEFFKREGSLAAKIKSEHVVRIHDVGEAPETGPYMVMELLEGFDLEHRLESGPLSVEEAVEHVVQACDALAEAHHLRIVHRDIKPANLFLAARAPRMPILKIIDFGISKMVARSAPAAVGQPLELTAGTPAYMAPEQIRGEVVDARADIWSLGVVLFELLTCDLPFPLDAPEKMLVEICTGVARSPRTVRPDLPPALEQVVMRCLARDPSQRIGSAAELADALQPFRAVDAMKVSGEISAVIRPVVADASRQAPTVVVRPKTSLQRAAVVAAVALGGAGAIGAGLIGAVALRTNAARVDTAPASASIAVIPSESTSALAPPPAATSVAAVNAIAPAASVSTAPAARAPTAKPRVRRGPKTANTSAPAGDDRSMFGERK